MRILHVMAGAKHGGSELIMLDSVLALAEAGLAQAVVTRDNSQRRLRAFKAAGVPVEIADFDKIVRAPTRTRISASVRAFEPDVIHYWLGRAGAYAPGKWRDISLGWHGGRHKLARFKNCSWHAAATKDIAAHIAAEGGASDRISVLSPFVQVEKPQAFDRALADTPEDSFVFFAIGKSGARKDWEALIEAAATLDNVLIWIEEELDPRVRALAEQTGVAAKLRNVAGLAPRTALMNAADGVVAACGGAAFADRVVEAWALRKPVVALGACGPAQNEVDVLIAPRGDGQTLRALMQKVLDDADLTRKLCDNGARAYRADFNKAAFVRNAMALYERVRAHTREAREHASAA